MSIFKAKSEATPSMTIIMIILTMLDLPTISSSSFFMIKYYIMSGASGNVVQDLQYTT